MAVTIDATVGGASSNSFVTLAEAATFMEGRLNASSWESTATTDEKNRALVEATRELSVLLWAGRRVNETQALSWPREWALNPDDPVTYWYDTDVIPQRVKDATCELAFQFIKSGTTDVAALPSDAELASKTTDVLSKSYVNAGQRRQGLRRFPRVWNYISPLVVTSGPTVPVIRG